MTARWEAGLNKSFDQRARDSSLSLIARAYDGIRIVQIDAKVSRYTIRDSYLSSYLLCEAIAIEKGKWNGKLLSAPNSLRK